MIRKAEVFSSRKLLLAAYPKAAHWDYGPIHKHDGKLFVQLYAGQHEWVAVNVEDISDIYPDPGWEGTEFGWGYVLIDESYQRPEGRAEISPPDGCWDTCNNRLDFIYK